MPESKLPDLNNYQVPAHPEFDYLLNDAECPLPTRGPRVTVGFWSATQAEYDGGGPPCVGAPLFTIVYPVGRGEDCYPWKHVAHDSDEAVHPNSAKHVEWVEGKLEFRQFTTLICVNEEGGQAPAEGTSKTIGWTPGQDFPPELYGRVIGADEVPVNVLRQDAVIILRAADGHFVAPDLDHTRNQMRCVKTQSSPQCELVAKFPNFVNGGHGGSGDEGEFALMAAGYYLVRTDVEGGEGGEDDRVVLEAKGRSIDEACLFTLSLPGNDVAVIQSAKDGFYLTHPCPGAGLELRREHHGVYGRFTIAYRKA